MRKSPAVWRRVIEWGLADVCDVCDPYIDDITIRTQKKEVTSGQDRIIVSTGKIDKNIANYSRIPQFCPAHCLLGTPCARAVHPSGQGGGRGAPPPPPPDPVPPPPPLTPSLRMQIEFTTWHFVQGSFNQGGIGSWDIVSATTIALERCRLQSNHAAHTPKALISKTLLFKGFEEDGV